MFLRNLSAGSHNFLLMQKERLAMRWSCLNSLPFQVYIDLTTRCNLKCRYCGIWQGEDKDIAPDVWMTVMRSLLATLKYPKINIAGGEPMLHPAFFDLITYASRKNAYVGFVTNGTLLNAAARERLARLPLANINISLDSLDPESFDAIRGRDGHTRQLQENIVALQQELSAAGSRTKVFLKSVIHAENYRTLTSLAQWVVRHHLAGLILQPISATLGQDNPPDWYRNSGLWPSDAADVIREIDKLQELKRQGLPIMNTISQMEQWKRYFTDPAAVYEHPEHDQKLCSIGFSHLFLFAGGEIKLCPEREPVGNVMHDDIGALLKSSARRHEQQLMKHCRHTACTKTCITQRGLLELFRAFRSLVR